MPDARAWLAILAVALAPQEGAGDRGKQKDEQEKEKAPWLGPRAPTREERASAEELRKDRELRLERAAASSERLAAFEARLAVDWLAGRPSLARERGLPPLDTAPLELGPDARRTWRGALQRAQGELESVDWPNLDPTRRLDREWLGAFLEVELALDALVPERGSPVHALNELEGVLGGVLVAQELEVDERMQVLTRHLAGLPETLATIRSALAHPEPAACQHAILIADDLLLLLQARLTPRLAAARPTAELWEPFEAAQKAAEQAVLAFRAWLAKEAEGEGSAPVLGPGAWRLVAGALTAGEVDLAALKVRLLSDIAALDAGLPAPQPSEEAWHESLLPAKVAQRLRETQAHGWAAAVDLGLVRGDTPAIGCTVWTAGSLPGLPLDLRWGDRPVLLVVANGASWSDETAARRKAELGTDALRAHALAMGFPGALWELWSRRSQRIGQRTFWNRAQHEGYRLYAADWATRPLAAENPLSGDAALLAEVRRDRQLEAARLLAALEIHAEGMSADEAARSLAGYADLDPVTAGFEARLALVDPLYGCGYLGYLQLLTAEEALQERYSERQAVWWVGRLLSHAPSTPIRTTLGAFDAFEAEFGAEAPQEPLEAPQSPAEEGR